MTHSLKPCPKLHPKINQFPVRLDEGDFFLYHPKTYFLLNLSEQLHKNPHSSTLNEKSRFRFGNPLTFYVGPQTAKNRMSV